MTATTATITAGIALTAISCCTPCPHASVAQRLLPLPRLQMRWASARSLSANPVFEALSSYICACFEVQSATIDCHLLWLKPAVLCRRYAVQGWPSVRQDGTDGRLDAWWCVKRDGAIAALFCAVICVQGRCLRWRVREDRRWNRKHPLEGSSIHSSSSSSSSVCHHVAPSSLQ